MAATKLLMSAGPKDSRSLSPAQYNNENVQASSSMQAGYNLVIGDVQEKMKQDIERKEANRNLHDSFNEGRTI